MCSLIVQLGILFSGLVVSATPATLPATQTQPTTCPAIVSLPKFDWPMIPAGYSVEKRPIEFAAMGSGKDIILIFAGIHGDEKSGIELIVKLGEFLRKNPDFLKGKTLILLPIANPDGYVYNTRENAHKVDLNRNFDTANRKEKRSSGICAMSEPEAQTLKMVIDAQHPARIVSIHQIVKLKGPITRGLIDYNGPAEIIACRMSECCPLAVKKWGARPGSFGSYAGEEHRIPTITFELHKDAIRESADQLWKTYGQALLAAIAYPDRLPKKIDILPASPIHEYQP